MDESAKSLDEAIKQWAKEEKESQKISDEITKRIDRDIAKLNKLMDEHKRRGAA